MEEAVPAGVWQYKARWRSTLGSIALFLVFFGVLLTVLGVAAGRGSIALAAGGVGLLALAWVLARPLFTGAWVLRIGPRGISGHMLNGRTVPWRDLRDLDVETVQGNTMLVLRLDPLATESLEKTRRWLSGKKPERRIPLNGLRKDEVAEAVAAARATFQERAGRQAAAAAAAQEAEARRELAFAQALARHTRTPWALYVLVALNVGVWVANLFAGVSPMRPTSPELFRWGANSAWAVTREHEYWRLLAGTFLHGGAVHLGMNMLGLWGAGLLLNRLYGNGQFLLVYLLSALAGAAASLHFSAQAAVSVGASGAVFGVVSALVVAARRHREDLPKALVRQIFTSEVVFLGYSLLNGFSRQGIDNAAHVGGLVAGAAMGWVLAGAVGGAAVGSGARFARAAGTGVAVMAAVVAAVLTTPTPAVDHARLFQATGRLQAVVPRLQAANAELAKDAQDAQAGRLPEAQFAERLETRHLPALQKLRAELAQVPQGQGDPRAPATADMLLLTERTIEGLEIELRSARGQAGFDDHARAAALKQEVAVIARRLRERFAALQASSKQP